MNLKFATPILVAALVFSGCSSHNRAGTPSADRNTITRQQIRDNHFQNAYDAVAALHSIWLQTRGTDSFLTPSEVKVIFDSANLGGVDTLRGIPAIDIEYIRWYDGNAATTRWGVGHTQGVIFVSSHSE